MLIGTSRALAQQALAACARRPGGVAAAALDSALGRQAWLSSAAQVEEASFRHAPVPPGSRLRLLLPGTAADIEVAVGEHEAVDIALAGPGAGSLSFHCSTALDGSAAIELKEAKATAGRRGEADGAQPRLRVLARIPSRFISVVAVTRGAVSVEAVQEASLSVASAGGAVSLPKVKGTSVAVDTGGGALSGALSASIIEVETGGGAVDLRSLVGNNVAVATGGGRLAVGAVYGGAVSLASGSGDIVLGTLDCKQDGGAAALDSHGGAISVEGIDGDAELRSGGGAVTAHLQDNAGRVAVDSRGGDVRLRLSPGVAGRLEVRGGGGGRVALPENELDRLEEGPGSAVVMRLAAAAGGGPPSRLQLGGAGPGATEVLLSPGAGATEVSRCGWLEALQLKMAASK